MLIMFIYLLVFTYGTSFFVLLLARSLHGVASAFITVAGMGNIATLFEEDEERSK